MYAPRPDPFRERKAERDVVRVDGGLETVRRVVRDPYGVLHRREPDDRRHGSERLLLEDPSVLGNPIEDGREIEAPLGVPFRPMASGEDLGRPASRILDQRFDPGDGGGIDERPDLGRLVRRGAHPQVARALREGVGEPVGDPFGDEEPLRRGADLARVTEDAPGRGIDRRGEGRVLEYDERVQPPHLEYDALSVATRALR